MNNSIETLEVMLGIVKAGACVVPISGLLTGAQIAALIDDSDAVGLFVSDSLRHLVEDTSHQMPKVRPALRIGHDFSNSSFQRLTSWLEGASTRNPPVEYSMQDTFNIIYSSGTTGTPKGIVQTHRARQHWSYSNSLEMRFDDRSIALVTTSLYSNGSWFMVLPPLFVGATMVIMEKFSAGDWLQVVERERITHTFMVPTQLISVLACPALSGHDLTSLRAVISAGSPLRDETKFQVLEKISPNLFELYGFSEGFATIIKPEEVSRKLGSVGRPVIGFELRIIDEAGRETPTGEVGEIAGRGAGLMQGYHKRAEETAAALWLDERGRTFFKSGDMGRLDSDGCLYIVDRKKDMILTGGFNVFPKDLEAVLGSHPDVEDVAVIGIPHEKWGETPLGLVIAKLGSTPDAEEIRAYANAKLGKTQQIQRVELRDEFPRNALGKVLKRVLRESYWLSDSGKC